jgi:hypothetical protein
MYPEGSCHEAGHAVVAYSLGLSVDAARVRMDDASGGTDNCCCSALLPFIDQLAVVLAGAESEVLFKKPSHRWASAKDHAKIIRLLTGISEEQGDILRAAGRKRAQELLTTYEHAAVRVAERLIGGMALEAGSQGLTIGELAGELVLAATKKKIIERTLEVEKPAEEAQSVSPAAPPKVK